jgi:Tfp pilus assembly protein PilO
LLKRIVAAAIIILIAFAFVQWGMDAIYAYEWEKTAPERTSLVTDIQNTRKIINQPVVIDKDLSQKLTELNTQIERETVKFPDSVSITDEVDDLLHLAQDTGIQIIPLRNGEWVQAREPGYMTYQIQLLVVGNIDDVVSFVDQVESTMLYSINIENMEMKWTGTGQEDETALETDTVEGYITVTVYKRT